ncbi:MAG: DUF202 domain-containing protein [Patescibacteria group bacterium]
MNIRFYKKLFSTSSQEKEEDKLYQDFLVKELILRDYLAIERTMLTNEATFLAYIRTSLTVIVVGVTLVKLVEEPMLELLGIIFTLLGILVFIFGFIKSIKMKNKINYLKRNKEAALESIK